MLPLDTGPEPFFEDVVNHMSAICGTPIALVALEAGPRFWISRPAEERGEETGSFARELFDLMGRSSAIVEYMPFPSGLWSDGEAPRAYISVPLYWRGTYVGFLAIADVRARVWTDFERNYMVRAARLVANHFEARATVVERDAAQEKLAAALTALEAERNGLEARVAERTLALEDAMRAAQEANTAKSMFLATVSHELRTPLHTIVSFTEMVKEDIESATPDAKQIARDLERIVTSSHHLLELISGVIDFSQIEAGEMELHTEPVALTPLLEECFASVRHSATSKGNTLTLLADPGIETIATDRMRLKQCLLNLLTNAAKFTTNGAITLKVDYVRSHTARWLRIAVADTGVGMSEQTRERLFEPFYQADSSYTRAAEGAGLGLALTYKLVGLLGGMLGVESAQGVGSTFTVHLPLDAALARAG